jgi:hypothetical protein
MKIKFENTEVFNFAAALRGMRNPMNSWHRNDSTLTEIGPNDLDLALRLTKAGPEHRKFLRQVFIAVDITAPRYWWSEFDTYKIGTAANSCSTMHKLHDHALTLDDFEVNEEDMNNAVFCNGLNAIIDSINDLRNKYLESKEFVYIRLMKKLLPESFLQKRTVTMNFEVLRNMYKQRKSHRLPEWREAFVEWVNTIPYAQEFIIN